MDGNLVWSKLATIVLICITCIGTRNKKHLEFDARRQVFYPLVGGLFVTILSIWLFGHRMDMRFYTISLNIWLYMAASILGTICIHVALDNISKFLKEGLLKDRFNFENESFEQCQELQENKYSVNIPMRYYYKGKFRKGWVNIVNPFRGTWVVGTPGSGKTFSIIEPFIRQHSAKGFAMVVYDYKFPTLAQKLYYHYKINQKAGKVPQGCKFNIINFVDVEYSRRVNPIQQKYIGNLAAASETAETLLESLQKGKKEGGGGSDQFFQTSAVNFLAACIYFFVNYKKVPYDKNGNHCTLLAVAIHRESGTEGVETAVAVFRIDGLAIIISCKSLFQMSIPIPHVGYVVLEGEILLDVRSCIHYSLPSRLAYREGKTG